LKDNLGEGQHQGVEEIILKVGDIGEESRSGRDARTVWAGKRKVSGGSGGGGPANVCHAGQNSLGFL
jgi:hypothetical protein